MNSGKDNIVKLPVNISHLDIEIVRGCFLKCRWCPLDKEQPYQFIGLDLFEKIINALHSVNGGYHKIDLFRGGEPFLHPDIKALLSILEAKGFVGKSIIGFFTNGMAVKHEQIKAIMESSLNIEVVFSVDGVGTGESFEYMRTGAKWEIVRKNISLLSEAGKGSVYGARKKIAVSTIIPHQDAVPFSVPKREEIYETFKKEFRPLGVDEFYFRDIHRYNGRVVIEGMPEREIRSGPCCFVKRGGISILVDGRVSTCCGDLNNSLIIGDLSSETLEEIFYGQSLLSIKEKMLKGERSALEICGACDLR
ncbi:MAG: radical SAM protein [Nitrospirae bacterium]|nr:radical SAM protein [Nitrospirota bacterium]